MEENTILDLDSDLHFPVVTVVSASAGSGKTEALTMRWVQFLLSQQIPHNSLKSLLAITFTNNAAREMRERVLRFLKNLFLGDPKCMQNLKHLVSADEHTLITRAGFLIDAILENYTDFQVRTIDSFMATVFKTSSLEFGFHPDFEILMRNDLLIDYTFDTLSRDTEKFAGNAEILDQLVDIIGQLRPGESSYLWDPYDRIADEVKKVYSILAAQTKPVLEEDLSGPMEESRKNMRLYGRRLREIIDRLGVPATANSQRDLDDIERGHFNELLSRVLKSTPVIKSRFALLPQRSRDQIESAQETLNEEIRNYARLHARSFYQPYLRAFALADRTLEAVKKQYGKIFIDDVNKKLADQLNADIVPEVYFKLGDVIYHYLIDEFQDTSPIQWTNLKPLIENSLSQGGSLFVVGDTKQSIFGFRRADWRIMKRMFAQPEFPAARHDPRSLPMNYRSLGNIVAFNVQVFQERMSGTEFATAAEKSGLNHVDQQVKPENEHQGYVEVALFDRASGDGQEMDAMLGIINECLSRGYRYGDIAVLTRTNNTVVEASARLNQHRIPFLSYSSLDVRKRKVTGEVIALLKFLDSPIDDLSLSAFLLGDIFQRILHHDAETTTLDDIREFVFSVRTARDNEYLYKAFQSFYPHLWQKYFEEPYALVGYLPLYDLVSELYKRFAVFELCPDEEAAFVKVLEVVKGFEQAGNNSIKDFLEVASDEQESAEWEISAPTDLDAVQVMTVHKAKGLGFPVVIVLLYNEVRDPGRVYIIEEVETGVRLLRITKEMSAKDENLQRLYEEDDSANRVDRLNQLYVALTRAKQEMYVLGAYDDKDKPPISFLPDSGYSIGEKCAPEPDRTPEAVRPAIRHSTIRKPVPFKEHERLNLVETRRGEFIHAILAHIEYVDDGIGDTLKKIIASLDESMKGQFPGTETEKTILAFLKGDIREFFLPRQGRRVVREQEYCDRCGALFRVDRVVIDRENVTVIDYKTGRDDKHEIYEEQVRNYMGILSDLYPGKHAAGIIAYVDRNVQRAVQ